MSYYKLDREFWSYLALSGLTVFIIYGICSAMALGSVLVFTSHINHIALLAVAIIITILSAYDFRYKILPNAWVLALGILHIGLALNLAHALEKPSLGAWSIAGGIVGASFLWGVRRGVYAMTGRIGLGLGDVKLMGAIGLGVGPFTLPYIILIASGTGIVLGVIRKFIGRSSDPRIAFGPFLLLGYWLSLGFADQFMVFGSQTFCLLFG